MEDKKNKILEAATELFVQKGFSGTSISDIAKLARVNQSLIYHHIGSKEMLWKEVKRTLLEKKTKSVPDQPINKLSDFLNYAVQSRLEIYERDPRILRLIQWQQLENDSEKLMGGAHAAPLDWIGMIEALQENRTITTAYPADLIAIYIHSLVNGLLLDSFYIFVKDDEKREAYIKMIKETASTFLRGKEPERVFVF